MRNNILKAATLFLLTGFTNIANAQNVGIGTNTPLENLHIFQPLAAVQNNNILYMQNAVPNGRNIIKMQSASGNPFIITKISPSEFVNYAGIPLNGGTQIVNTDNGSMMIANGLANSIHMATNNKLRLTVDGPTGALFLRPAQMSNFTAGETDLGIRRDTLSESQSWLELRDSSNNGNIAGFMSTNASLDGYGPRVQIGNNSFGNTKITFWTNGSGYRMLIHDNGNVGIGMPTLDDPGAKLYINGNLKITDGTQGNGKVLTSDAAGLASWQNLPGSATSWAVSGSDIYNSNTGNVGIGITAPNYKLHVQGELFVQSSIKLGITGGNYWNWSTTNAGADVKMRNFNGVTETSQHYFAQNGNVGIGSGDVVPTEKLVINNGFLKVSGTNKTAFTVTATAGNTTGNNTAVSYASQSSTDIVIVTHNWQGAYMGAIGVYFFGGAWRLFREDLAAIPLGEKFNVMVIKQ